MVRFAGWPFKQLRWSDHMRGQPLNTNNKTTKGCFSIKLIRPVVKHSRGVCCKAACGWLEVDMGGRVLVTFDVDGTLMQSSGTVANKLHRRAFSYAFNSVFGIDGTIDAIQHHGQTDPAVIVNTLVHYGVTRDIVIEKLPALKSNMIQFAKDHANEIQEGLELLPGVLPLLEVLALQKDVVAGLVTGNLEEIAWMKMDGLGIRKYFTVPNFGGFGSDHDDRGQLVKIAAERAGRLFPGGFHLHVHVGDTPNDIQAAEFGGALPIGVCTGVFKKEELEKASSGNAYLLDNLTDSKKFLSILGIESGV